MQETNLLSIEAPARARHFGRVNWLGLWTLYNKEIGRFMRVWLQTVLAPIVSNVLYMTVFVVVVAERRGMDATGDFIRFLIPGLIMLGILGNASANTSSSIMTSKVNGSIIDVLMPPLSPTELAVGYLGGAITRGLLVAVVNTIVLSFFALLIPKHLWAVFYYGISAAACMGMVGMLAGIWAEKFDQLAVVNQFIILPLSMLSGTFYSISSLPPLLHKISLFNPLFYFIDGMRYGFLGMSDGNIQIGIIYTASLNIVLFILCLLVLKSGWRLKA